MCPHLLQIRLASSLCLLHPALASAPARAYKHTHAHTHARRYGFNMRVIKDLAMVEPLVDVVEPKQVGDDNMGGGFRFYLFRFSLIYTNPKREPKQVIRVMMIGVVGGRVFFVWLYRQIWLNGK